MVPVDLRADGLLWLINSSTFHPRGYALALGSDGQLYLMGDGREPWRFELPDAEFDSLFLAVQQALTRCQEATDAAATPGAGESSGQAGS